MSMQPIDLNKASHIRFSQRTSDRLVRERDCFLALANDAATAGQIARALTLREVTLGLLPRH